MVGHAPRVQSASRGRRCLCRHASRRISRQTRLLCPMHRGVDSLSNELACLLRNRTRYITHREWALNGSSTYVGAGYFGSHAADLVSVTVREVVIFGSPPR